MNKQYLQMAEDLGLSSMVTTLIETGTHRGWGAQAWSTIFDQVHTIELSESLYDYCVQTYDISNVNFINAASTDVLEDLINDIKGSYILFLDAHGSGGDTTYDQSVGRFGSPVLEEIECSRSKIPECIIVDDLSDFGKVGNYPTKEMIIDKVSEIGDYEHEEYVTPSMFKGALVFKKK
jgi:hypothetical protein